MGDWRAGCGPT
uniref:Uncharacterized protein n=1 Tax=Arundo donax TaxID=35708 RepID=A0A0A9AHL5_ARUDO